MKNVSEILAHVPLFESLDADELQALASAARLRSYSTGANIVTQGDEANEMFAIVAGRARVVSHGRDGNDVLLGWMQAGEVFGEVALLDSGTRSASVIAAEACQLVVIAHAPFMAVLSEQPAVAIKLLRTLARRLRRLTERSDDVAFLEVPQRLAKTILRLANEVGQVAADGSIRVAVRISQGELGQVVGATRESVNKYFSAWRREGIISHTAGTLTVLSRARLQQLAEQA